jgi:tetratricopeptide (TPR) repeat protein
MRHHTGNKRRRARASIGTIASFTALAIAGLGLAATAATAGTVVDGGKVSLRAQLGIIYAQNGQNDEARKEFVKLLEEPTGRATALTNLGNLAMLDGLVDVAVENYVQAAALDTVDGGILLNLGIAHRQAGREVEADLAVTRALAKTGGVEQAQYLLGIRSDSDTSRGKVSKLSNQEIKAMLAKAKTRVPDATAAPADAKKTGGTQVVSRPGGARAADVSVGATSLYWKER